MKKYLIVDITGRVWQYDQALVGAIDGICSDEDVRLLLPRKGLISFIPKKYEFSEYKIKRIARVFEALINYIYIVLVLTFSHIDVLHLQWLPFLEINEWEIPLLALMRKVAPRTRIVLTIHNVYPHNMDDNAKKKYNTRFRKACYYIDAFIVHTEISKQEAIREFGLSEEKVTVCCHGVFVPKNVSIKQEKRDSKKYSILQFGTQSYYKGTDVLVDAACGLSEKENKRIEIRIIGGIKSDFLEKMKAKDINNAITWRPHYIEDIELFEEINNSDLIVLPYRAISQSGVLLLAIYFEKNIICSDLPSFVETMRGKESKDLDDSLFFKSEDAENLRNLIRRYANRTIDEKAVKARINHLKQLYSWKNAAISTLCVYRNNA